MNYIGLFGEIGEAGAVKNIKMTDIYLEAGAYTGYGAKSAVKKV